MNELLDNLVKSKGYWSDPSARAEIARDMERIRQFNLALATAHEERLKKILSTADIERIKCSSSCPYENIKRLIDSHEALRAEAGHQTKLKQAALEDHAF